jgi:hypothetical protein
MKHKAILFLSLVTSLILSSCGSYKVFTGSVTYDAQKENEIIKSNELKSGLSGNSRIKFVLRTPPGFSSMPEEKQNEMNQIFAYVEKELIKKGYIVKDRVLLENLLKNHNYSLTDISKIIDTDIILEILDVRFDIPNHIKNFKIKEKGLNTTFDNWLNINYVDCQLSMMECRITLADSGDVGGIFRFYVSGCDKDKDFYIRLYEDFNGNPDPEKEAFVGWNYGNVSYKTLTNSYDMNYESKKIALERLIDALLKELNPE